MFSYITDEQENVSNSAMNTEQELHSNSDRGTDSFQLWSIRRSDSNSDSRNDSFQPRWTTGGSDSSSESEFRQVFIYSHFNSRTYLLQALLYP